MKLTAENVRNIFMDCLYREEEKDRANAVIAKGITMNVGFHPERLQSHTDEIVSMLDCLPKEFNEKSGGGWSFLEACVTKDGFHWGEHRNMEELFILGIAIKKVDYLLPKELWYTLPCGLPYLVIKD